MKRKVKCFPKTEEVPEVMLVLVHLAPEHAPPGVIRLEDVVEPVEVGLAEVRVMQEPPLVLGLEALVS